MGKYRIETDNGTYEIETDEAPGQAGPVSNAPAASAPSTMERIKGYFANRPSLNDVTDGKMHALGGPEKYVLMGALGSGVPGAAAGFRAAIPGIAKGASKMGIGAALDSAGVPAHVGTLLGAREGIPNIVSGVREGIAAGRAASQAASPAARLSRAIEPPISDARPLPAPIAAPQPAPAASAPVDVPLPPAVSRTPLRPPIGGPRIEPAPPAIKDFDTQLGDLRQQYGLERQTSPVNTRFDEGSPSPTIASATPRTKIVKPSENLKAKGPDAVKAAEAFAKQVKKK